MEEQQRSTSGTEVNSTALAASQIGKFENYKGKKYFDIIKKEGSQDKKCDNCKKMGHTIEDCYYLKGFPSTHPLHGVFPRSDKDKDKYKKEGTREEPKDMLLNQATKIRAKRNTQRTFFSK